MLKLNKKLNNFVTIQAEGETQLDLFKAVARAEEVFGEHSCGKCNSESISFRVRVVQDGKKTYEYPELVCNSCYAKLSFGQMEGGELFPVRFQREDGEYVKDNNGKYIPKGTRGWTKYNKDTKKEE